MARINSMTRRFASMAIMIDCRSVVKPSPLIHGCYGEGSFSKAFRNNILRCQNVTNDNIIAKLYKKVATTVENQKN